MDVGTCSYLSLWCCNPRNMCDGIISLLESYGIEYVESSRRSISFVYNYA